MSKRFFCFQSGTQGTKQLLSIFWANSGLGVVTLPDFWSIIHKGKVRVVRESLKSIDRNALLLQSNERVPTDFIVMCTGWGDHFALFDAETKRDIGLPTQTKPKDLKFEQKPDRWQQADQDADAAVNLKLPFLEHAPVLRNPECLQRPQRKWRLYRRAVPLELAEKGDRSLVILGQIHTVQTPLVAEFQSFWAILYLLGRVTLPDSDTMVREIAEWNAWTRKRYLSQGQKFPYSLYDFLPVCYSSKLNSTHDMLIAPSMLMRYVRTWGSTLGESQIPWQRSSLLTVPKTSMVSSMSILPIK